MIRLFIFLAILLALPFKGFSQENTFTILDVSPTQKNYLIITCRDDSAKTIQFQADRSSEKTLTVPGRQIADPFKPGTKVKADFSSGSVYFLTSPSKKYKIIKPGDFAECCISKFVTYITSGFPNIQIHYFQKAETPSNTFVTFAIPEPWSVHSPANTIGQQIYEKYFSGIRYAVLRPIYYEEARSHIFYTYLFPQASTIPDTTTSNDNVPWEFCCPIQSNSAQHTGFFNLYKLPGAKFSFYILATVGSIHYNTNGNQDTHFPIQFQVQTVEVWFNGRKLYVPINAETTRLKTGALHVVTNSPWKIYDNRDTVIYKDSMTKTIEFLIGDYKLGINGSMHPVQIKDSLLSEFIDSTRPPDSMQTQSFNTNVTQAWDIQPDLALKGRIGELTLKIPENIRYNTHLKIFSSGDPKKVLQSWFGNKSATLLPGSYDILVDNKYYIKNVPVEEGKQTRLLMGVLQWSGYGSVNLESADHQKFAYAAPFKIVLPQGNYKVEGDKNSITIKDGELTQH